MTWNINSGTELWKKFWTSPNFDFFSSQSHLQKRFLLEGFPVLAHQGLGRDTVRAPPRLTQHDAKHVSGVKNDALLT